VNCRPKTKTNNHQLRNEEALVIEAIVTSIPGSSWSPGENPPDAYLKTGNRKIAVEITTLEQHVIDEKGEDKVRRSEDETAFNLSKYFNKELNGKIQNGCELLLTLSAPIVKLGKVKQLLYKKIIELSRNASGRDVTDKIAICGNSIAIIFIHSDHPTAMKVKSIVVTPNSRKNTNILENAKHILKDRIEIKSGKCKSLYSEVPVWLALLNNYWIADKDTYKQALEQISIQHPFERIMLVERNSSVTTLDEV
jgi:hypothetical protein